VRFPLRRSVTHRGDSGWDSHDVTVRPDQMPLFEKPFGTLSVRRHRYFVYGIFGQEG